MEYSYVRMERFDVLDVRNVRMKHLEDYYRNREKALNLGFTLEKWWEVYMFWVDPLDCNHDSVKEAAALTYQTLYSEWLAGHETLLGKEAFNE